MFTLKTKEEERKIKFISNPTPEQIEREVSAGYTQIEHGKGSYFVNANDEYERDRVKKAIGVPDYEWFQETTGLKRLVLYNPQYYKPAHNFEERFILKFNVHDYDGKPLEMPINASSLCSMFSWMNLPKDLNFSKDFTLAKIWDTSLMFSGTILPKGFSLDERFNTSNVVTMRYMFYGCTIHNKNFFKTFLDTTNVLNFDYMFAESSLCKGLDIGLNTHNAKTMSHMFFNTTFNGLCNLGDDFVDPMKTKTMFIGARMNDIKLEGVSVSEVKRTLMDDFA